MNILSALLGNTGPALVLRRFRIDRNQKTMVNISGRKPGIIAWFLTKMGLDDETSLKVTRDAIYFKSSSMFGTTYTTVPLTMVSSTHCGYTKSGALLIIGVLLCTVGLPFVIPPIIGIFFLIGYWLSKKITIFLETSGGITLGLSFKRSVIENVRVDIDQAMQTTQIINQQITIAQAAALRHALQSGNGQVAQNSNHARNHTAPVTDDFDVDIDALINQ